MWLCSASVYSCVLSIVCLLSIKLVSTIFRKRVNRFRCNLVQVVHGARTWTGQLLEIRRSKVKVTRRRRYIWRRHHSRRFASNSFFELHSVFERDFRNLWKAKCAWFRSRISTTISWRGQTWSDCCAVWVTAPSTHLLRTSSPHLDWYLLRISTIKNIVFVQL